MFLNANALIYWNFIKASYIYKCPIFVKSDFSEFSLLEWLTEK